MSATSRSATLSPGTERWLQELTKDLPPDLIDPRELEDLPEDPFKKQLQSVTEPKNDLDNEMDTPLSSADADLLDAATEEQPPTPRALQKSKRRPKRRSKRRPRARKRAARAKPVFDEPGGYSAQYDEFDDLKSDEIPPQTGKWGRGDPYVEKGSVRAARRRTVDALFHNLRF
jgi:hypothetical protein